MMFEFTVCTYASCRVQAVYAAGVRHARQDSPDFHTLNDQIEEARLLILCTKCAFMLYNNY